MCSETLDFTCNEIAGYDTLSLTIDENHIQHFVTRIGLHGTCGNLAVQSGIGSEKKLLSGLSAGVEGTANLRTSKRTVGEKSAIFPCERNSLCDTLVDDVVADLSQTIDIGFAAAVVTSLDCVVEQTID